LNLDGKPLKATIAILAFIAGATVGVILGHPDNREKARKITQTASEKIKKLRNHDED